jgi:hypothetical protein
MAMIQDYPPAIVTLWRFLTRWGVPIMMTSAYIVLAITSETDATGWAWMSIGLGFVYVIWWTFRIVTETAALSRAAAGGDAARVLELADKQLARRPGKSRAPFWVWRAVALEMKGDAQAALAALDNVPPSSLKPDMALRAAAVRIAACVEVGDIAVARRALDALRATHPERLGPEAAVTTRLAEARVVFGEGELDAAVPLLQRVIDDIRAGEGQRALAHDYAARIADAQGKPGVAKKHRAEALRGQKPPLTAKPT